MGANQIFYHFKEGFRSIFAHGLMSFASACMIVVCLMIMGSFSLVALNINEMLETLEDDNVILAYIDETLPEQDARALQGRIEAIPNVKQDGVAFITRDEAMQDFVARNPDQSLFGEIPVETFRHRFRIHLDDIKLMQETVQQVKEVPGVDKTKEELAIAEGFIMLRNIASVLAIVLTVLLVVVSLFIISNTVRITTFTRREEIAIMKMCGATDWFIRWPFIFEGVIIGIFGALIAFGLQWGMYGILQTAIGNVGNLSFVDIMPFMEIARFIFWIFLGVGFLIGAMGSSMAIRKFLRV